VAPTQTPLGELTALPQTSVAGFIYKGPTSLPTCMFTVDSRRVVPARVRGVIARTSGVGVRLKVGINIEKIEGVGSGRGCTLPSWGSGGLPPEKNQFCAKNYAILSKFWYFFPILQQKGGGLSPSPESGGPIPLSPLLRRLWRGLAI